MYNVLSFIVWATWGMGSRPLFSYIQSGLQELFARNNAAAGEIISIIWLHNPYVSENPLALCKGRLYTSHL